MIKNTYSFNDIKKIYNNQYLFNIQQLLLNTDYEYKFISFKDLFLSNENIGTNFILESSDLFLESYSKDKILLAKDILKNGTYWPCFITKDNKVIEGQHRVFSLQLYNNLVNEIDLKLLCFISPFDVQQIYNKNSLLSSSNLNNPVEYYHLNEESLTLEKIVALNSYLIHQSCFKISNLLLNNAIFSINKVYPNFISPHKIFNNELLFKKFLENKID